MKRIVLFLFAFAVSEVSGQNEFAATAFYTDFKKICADARDGFILYRGDRKESEYEELSTEYHVKLLLPLADSGKIVVPVDGGNPYVIYFFEPGKNRLKVDQRALNLREAVLTAYNKPLYARTETSIVNNHPFTNSYYFTDPSETRSAWAAFRMTIYFFEEKYYLSFEIRGKKEK